MKAAAAMMMSPIPAATPAIANVGIAGMDAAGGGGAGEVNLRKSALKKNSSYFSADSDGEEEDEDREGREGGDGRHGGGDGQGGDEQSAGGGSNSLERKQAKVAVSGASLLESSELLPKVVEKYLLRELGSNAQMIISGHPLATTLTGAMVLNMAQELSKEVQGIAAAAFFAFMHHRQALQELPESLSNGAIPSIESDPDKALQVQQKYNLTADHLRVIDQVKEAVDHVLHVSSGE